MTIQPYLSGYLNGLSRYLHDRLFSPCISYISFQRHGFDALMWIVMIGADAGNNTLLSIMLHLLNEWFLFLFFRYIWRIRHYLFFKSKSFLIFLFLFLLAGPLLAAYHPDIKEEFKDGLMLRSMLERYFLPRSAEEQALDDQLSLAGYQKKGKQSLDN